MSFPGKQWYNEKIFLSFRMIRKALENRSVNLLNLHFGLFFFAEGLINIFLGIYLFESGIPLPFVFLSIASIELLRLAIRPSVLWLWSHIGLRKTLIFGTLCFVPMYLALGKVDGMNIWLLIFIIIAAVPNTIYWTSYHPYFSILGDVEHRGKQIGMREIGTQMSAFLAPFCGGILVSSFGFVGNVTAAIGMIFLAILPLFSTAEITLPPPRSFRQALREVQKEGFWLFFADGVYQSTHDFMWKLVLFSILGNYLSFGGLLSLAIIFQIIGSFLIGHVFDNGNGKKVYPIGVGILSLVVIGRVFFAFSIPTVIFLDLLFMVGYCLFFPIKNATVYNISKNSHCPLWFHCFAETGADLGSISGYVFAAIFVSLGGELRLIMLASMLGLFISNRILRKYFTNQKKISLPLVPESVPVSQ